MKVKEIDVTANMAWSPGPAVPIMIAAGTAAQQLDATFSTSSTIDIYELNLGTSGHDMPKISSTGVDNRYHKLVWGEAGMQNGDRPKGIIVGGLDRGFISVYDADKLIKGQEGNLIFSKDKHTGPVTALDFNPFQANLLASGASESEIFIWDLNRIQTPMTPGAKSQPVDDVRCIAWNRQVQHILASTFSSRCVVWDLRKNEPIIKVSDTVSRMRCKVVAWNPDVATQLCLASEDDHTPVIQIWDLRLASSPLRTLEHHQRGILSLAWCKQDSDLLLSCGKDNKILCWNPNTNQPGGEVLCELPTSSQWSHDVSFCPRNPGVLASSSFDGKISVYSLMGGQQQQEQPSSAIADSFPGMETLSMPVQSNYQAAPKESVQLKKPPKWLRRPCGANFGFGGKLVSFISEAAPATTPEAGPTSLIYVSGVVTETELIERSGRLETSLEHQNVSEFCQLKLNETKDEKDQEVWNFIQANFYEDPRKRFLHLLGYDFDKVSDEISSATGGKLQRGSPIDDLELNSGLSKLSTNDGSITTNGHHQFDDFEVIAAKTEEDAEKTKPFTICVDDSGPGLLSRALLTGNLNLAVDLCLEQNRFADALILSMQGGPELLQDTQKRYFAKCSESCESHLIRAVVSSDWRSVIERCDVSNWREALSAALTHAAHEELSSLCAYLGQRLLAQGNNKMGQEAMLCFICAGNLDKVVECWMETRDTSSGPKALQDLVEVVMSLKFAVEQNQGFPVEMGTGPLTERLSQYASLLASQGALRAALTYLIGQSSDENIVALRERLEGALNKTQVKTSQQPNQSRGTSVSKNQYTREPLSARQSWGQTAYPAAANPAPQLFNPVAPQPAIPLGGFSPAPHMSAYQHGIHNPAVEDLNSFNPPVPHYDHGGITQRRNSRPTNTPFGGYPSGDGASLRRISGESLAQQQQQQPSVNIFTPNFAQPTSPLGIMNPVGGGVQQVQPPPPQQETSAYMPPVSSGPGWNDPPPMSMFTSKSKGSALKPSHVPLIQGDPITQPVFGSTVPAPPSFQSPDITMMQTQYQQQQQPMYGGGVQQPVFEPNTYNPPQMGGYVGMTSPPQHQQQPAPISRTETPEPPRPKAPIPSEHIVIQEVFDGLRGRCLAAANHPQTRRKLDDVGKKLEVLYDKLRDNQLPQTTTAGLHEIVLHIWAFDYNSSLAVIHRLISSGSFDILAEFMPGVKVLIQVATQLGAYLERPR